MQTSCFYDFKKDLPIAEKSEKQVAEFLERSRGMKFLDKCNNSDYDIRMETKTGAEITIEVKEDFSCERTGNVGVEYSYRGRPSGIETTKADFYLYKVHRPDGIGLYVIKTDKLKKMIEDNLYFRTVNGGDPGSDSLNYLFKLAVFEQHFTFMGDVLS
jgi:hypothetical protein